MGAAVLLWLMTAMPGRSHRGPPAPLSAEETILEKKLKDHVEALAAIPRNIRLEDAADYVREALEAHNPRSQYFESGGRKVRNIEAGSEKPLLVVGAHYDAVPGTPGADDNASAVAALIELARLLVPERLPIRFVAFANEEPPYFMGPEMGSWVSANAARQRGEPLKAMISLEMLGYYSDAPGSQRYPFPLSYFYPDRGDFIAFVGDLGARSLVRRAIGAFRRHAAFPSEGVAAPSFIPGVTWSDHWSFRDQGYAAIMVTDTAFFRNPHYHLPSDTPERLDYERLARLTLGLAAMLRDMAKGAP